MRATGSEAVDARARAPPDLVFLDVQMPEIDGFGVLRALRRRRARRVVFVTAYDEYAMRAFDVHALDYVLKPFNDERFAQALARARDTLARSDNGATTHEKSAQRDRGADGRAARRSSGWW